MFGVGTGHCCHSVCTEINECVTRSFARPQLFSVYPKNAAMNYNLPHSTTNVHVVLCHVIYLAFIGRRVISTTSLTILLYVCRTSASLTRAMVLIIVHSVISVARVILISPRSLPTHHASRHVQTNQSLLVVTIGFSSTERLRKRLILSNQVSYPLLHSLFCCRALQVIPISRM